MGHLVIKANDYVYQERARRLKEQFINGIKDDDMMNEIVGDLAMIKRTNEVTIEQFLSWPKRVEV